MRLHHGLHLGESPKRSLADHSRGSLRGIDTRSGILSIEKSVTVVDRGNAIRDGSRVPRWTSTSPSLEVGSNFPLTSADQRREPTYSQTQAGDKIRPLDSGTRSACISVRIRGLRSATAADSLHIPAPSRSSGGKIYAQPSVSPETVPVSVTTSDILRIDNAIPRSFAPGTADRGANPSDFQLADREQGQVKPSLPLHSTSPRPLLSSLQTIEFAFERANSHACRWNRNTRGSLCHAINKH